MAQELRLRFSHNIIEHLGLKLYQNRPTNVIAELISNAWDADAKEVKIETNKDLITFFDNGHGMSADTIVKNYLVIAKLKRTKGTLEITSPEGRKFMGRKGIGKLAPFGIAFNVEVATCAIDEKGDYKFSWFELDFNEIMKKSSNGNVEDLKDYEPLVHELDTAFEEVDFTKDISGKVQSHFNEKKSGTLILMKDLRLRKEINITQLKESIGRRFTITLLREDFKIEINKTILDEEQTLPKFEFRIPESGTLTDKISIDGKDRKFQYWVGFVQTADWPTEEAGIGVYSHGKIAQDRPFFFNIKGREISARYMYGVIEADWIDEFEDDVISTDRTSIDWEHSSLIPFHEHCQKEVAKWIRDYQTWQKERNKKVISKKMVNSSSIPKVAESERSAIVDMVSQMGPKVSKDKEFQERVLETVTNAWIHKPMRLLIKQLWDSLDIETSEDNFVAYVQKLNDYLVPESLSVAGAVAQKVYALSKLYSLKILGNENQLQYLLEEFPWILSTDMSKLTANQELTTVVKEASKSGLIPADRRLTKELKESGKLKPDFVFFSNPSETRIVCVELKNPQISLSNWHVQQLFGYLNFVEEKYPDAKIKGWLIGSDPNNNLKENNKVTSIKVMHWNNVFTQSRREHIELLGAMLNNAKEFAEDDRAAAALKFGGKETKELLLRLSDSNEEFKDFIHRIDERIDSKSSHPDEK